MRNLVLVTFLVAVAAGCAHNLSRQERQQRMETFMVPLMGKPEAEVIAAVHHASGNDSCKIRDPSRGAEKIRAEHNGLIIYRCRFHYGGEGSGPFDRPEVWFENGVAVRWFRDTGL
jgi:hypothetical protein